MLGGVWFVYFCFGVTTSAIAPLVGRIVPDLHMSLAAMGSVLGAWQLVYVVTAVPAGAIVDRMGLARAVLVSALVIAASGALRAAADGYIALLLAVAVFGVGGPLVSIGAPKLISQWFGPGERGFAMGVYMTGPAVGAIFTLACTNSVLMPLTGHSWRGVLLVEAGLACASAVAWALIAARAPAREEARAVGDVSAAQVFVGLLRLPVVRTVLLMSVGVFFYNHAFTNWLPEILRFAGQSAVDAGYWASLPTAVGIGAALFVPRLATAPRRTAVLLALVGCEVAGALLLLHGGAPAVLAVALVVQGVGRGALLTVTMLALIESPGVDARHMGLAGGLFFAAGEVGGVLGPLTVGSLADVTGGFTAPLAVLAGVSALVAVGCVHLRRRA